MQKDSHQIEPSDLFGRVVSILETARTNVVRTVNSEMVAAYWLIGREIVEEIQRGEGRAKYGKKSMHQTIERGSDVRESSPEYVVASPFVSEGPF